MTAGRRPPSPQGGFGLLFFIIILLANFSLNVLAAVTSCSISVSGSSTGSDGSGAFYYSGGNLTASWTLTGTASGAAQIYIRNETLRGLPPHAFVYFPYNSVPPASGSSSYTTPYSMVCGNQCIVVLTVDGVSCQTSPTFRIKAATIIVTTGIPGSVFYTGRTTSIFWQQYSGPSRASFTLSLFNSSSRLPSSRVAVLATVSYYTYTASFTFPSISAVQDAAYARTFTGPFYVEIANMEDTNAFVRSASFTISMPTITFTSPSASSVFYTGSSISVAWTTIGLSSETRIFIVLKYGTTFVANVTSSPTSTSPVLFKIPAANAFGTSPDGGLSLYGRDLTELFVLEAVAVADAAVTSRVSTFAIRTRAFTGAAANASLVAVTGAQISLAWTAFQPSPTQSLALGLYSVATPSAAPVLITTLTSTMDPNAPPYAATLPDAIAFPEPLGTSLIGPGKFILQALGVSDPSYVITSVPFTLIRPSIDVTMSATTCNPGDSISVTWTTDGLIDGNVKVEILNLGLVVATLSPSTPLYASPAPVSTWNVPSQRSSIAADPSVLTASGFFARITSLKDAGVVGFSSPFTVSFPGKVVLEPVASAVAYVGESISIRWIGGVTGGVSALTLHHISAPGTILLTIATGVQGGSTSIGSYTWNIPASGQLPFGIGRVNTTGFFVRVSYDATFLSGASGTFSIVQPAIYVEPNATFSTILTANTNTLVWTTARTTGTMRISAQLRRTDTNAVLTVLIKGDIPVSAGITSWTFPSSSIWGSAFAVIDLNSVRLVLEADADTISAVTSSFIVTPSSLLVTSPTSATVANTESPIMVEWTSTRYGATLEIALIHNPTPWEANGSRIIATLLSGVPIEQGSVGALIPAASSYPGMGSTMQQDYSLVVSVVEEPLDYYYTSTFTVLEKPAVHLVSSTPDSGVAYTGMSSFNISWASSTGVTEAYPYSLSLVHTGPSGGYTYAIASGLSPTGSLLWSIPTTSILGAAVGTTRTTGFRLVLTHGSDASVNATGSTFTIRLPPWNLVVSASLVGRNETSDSALGGASFVAETSETPQTGDILSIDFRASISVGMTVSITVFAVGTGGSPDASVAVLATAYSASTGMYLWTLPASSSLQGLPATSIPRQFYVAVTSETQTGMQNRSDFFRIRQPSITVSHPALASTAYNLGPLNVTWSARSFKGYVEVYLLYLDEYNATNVAYRSSTRICYTTAESCTHTLPKSGYLESTPSSWGLANTSNFVVSVEPSMSPSFPPPAQSSRFTIMPAPLTVVTPAVVFTDGPLHVTWTGPQVVATGGQATVKFMHKDGTLFSSVRVPFSGGSAVLDVPYACNLATTCAQTVEVALNSKYGVQIESGFLVSVVPDADTAAVGTSPTFNVTRRPWDISILRPDSSFSTETMLPAQLTWSVTGGVPSGWIDFSLWYLADSGTFIDLHVALGSVNVSDGSGSLSFMVPAASTIAAGQSSGGFALVNTSSFFIVGWSRTDTTMWTASNLFSVVQVPLRILAPSVSTTIYTSETLAINVKAVDLPQNSLVHLYLLYPAPVASTYTVVSYISAVMSSADAKVAWRVPPAKNIGEAYAITKTDGFRILAVSDTVDWKEEFPTSTEALAEGYTVQEVPDPLRPLRPQTIFTVPSRTSPIVELSGLSRISSAPLTILRPLITVTAPERNTVLLTGGIATITWSTYHVNNTVNIFLFYFTERGATLVKSVVERLPVANGGSVEGFNATGRYVWAIPTASSFGSGFALTRTDKFYFAVVSGDDSTVRGPSPLFVTIKEPPKLSITVTQPRAGDVTRMGAGASSRFPISWTSVGIGSDVSIELFYSGWGRDILVMRLDGSTGLGSKVILKVEDATRQSTANWTVPVASEFPSPSFVASGANQEYGTTYSSYFFIRITSKDMPEIRGDSEPYFVILPQAFSADNVLVSQPESGSTFVVDAGAVAAGESPAEITIAYRPSQGLIYQQRSPIVSIALMYASFFGNVKVRDICGHPGGMSCSSPVHTYEIPADLGVWGSKYVTNFFVTVRAVKDGPSPSAPVIGTSSPYFYIMPPRRFIAPTLPAAGKTYVVGRPLRIAFTALSSVTEPVSVTLYCVDPSTGDSSNVNITTVATNVAPTAGELTWVVPSSAVTRSTCLGYFVSITGFVGEGRARVAVRGETDGLFDLAAARLAPVPSWRMTMLFGGFTRQMVYGTPDLDNVLSNTIAGMFELPPIWVKFSSFGVVSCTGIVNSTCAGQQDVDIAMPRRMLEDLRREMQLSGRTRGLRAAAAGDATTTSRHLQGQASYLSVSLDIAAPPAQYQYCRNRIEGFVDLPNTDGRKVATFAQLALRLDDSLGLARGTVSVQAVASKSMPAPAPQLDEADSISASREPVPVAILGGGIGGGLAVIVLVVAAVVAARTYQCRRRDSGGKEKPKKLDDSSASGAVSNEGDTPDFAVQNPLHSSQSPTSPPQPSSTESTAGLPVNSLAAKVAFAKSTVAFVPSRR